MPYLRLANSSFFIYYRDKDSKIKDRQILHFANFSPEQNLSFTLKELSDNIGKCLIEILKSYPDENLNAYKKMINAIDLFIKDVE